MSEDRVNNLRRFPPSSSQGFKVPPRRIVCLMFVDHESPHGRQYSSLGIDLQVINCFFFIVRMQVENTNRTRSRSFMFRWSWMPLSGIFIAGSVHVPHSPPVTQDLP